MTQERTYPREWFKVTRWTDKPELLQFQKETEHFLFTGTRKFKKWTDYERWYPTIEEAQAAIAALKAEKAEADRLRCLHDAAPALLEALEEATETLRHITKHWPDSFAAHHARAGFKKTCAAIAQAKGDSA